MALKRHSPKITSIKDNDGEEIATVHGLSFSAITTLININRPAVEALFEQFSGREPDSITETEVSAVGQSMFETAPLLVAQIIAAATDAYEEWDGVSDTDNPITTIMAWPLGLQWAALEAIAPLTFNAGGGAKKMLALALQVARNQGRSLLP